MNEFQALKQMFERTDVEVTVHDLPAFEAAGKPQRKMMLLWHKNGDLLTMFYFNRHDELIEVRP